MRSIVCDFDSLFPGDCLQAELVNAVLMECGRDLDKDDQPEMDKVGVSAFPLNQLSPFDTGALLS